MEPAVPAPTQWFPWHDRATAQLQLAWANARLPHALLLQGADGLGKKSLATWLACAVLCKNSSTLQRCAQCSSCKLTAAGSHPDLFWIGPEEDKQQISVDQIRAAAERFSKTSYLGGYKIAIIEPAHQMTHGAANSVLKTLEEPPAGSLLILITSRPSSLPATVRSRCQRIAIQRPTRDTALAWLHNQSGPSVSPQLLEFTAGAPLLALKVARNGDFDEFDRQMTRWVSTLLKGETDVAQVASEWAGKAASDRFIDRLLWLDLWLTSQARAAVVGSAYLVTVPIGLAHLPSLPPALNISAVYSLVDRLRALKAQLSRTSLQRELAIESWLVALLNTLAPLRASIF